MSANPKDRKYSKTHEWFLRAGDIITIGITQFAADELTDITFVDWMILGTSNLSKDSSSTIFETNYVAQAEVNSPLLE